MSRWAARYGLPDPGSMAAAVTDANPDTASASATTFRSATTAALFCADLTGDAASAVRRGWSAPQPYEQLRRLTEAARSVAETSDATAAAADRLAASIRAAQGAISRAFEAARQSVVELVANPLTDVERLLDEFGHESRRRAIVELLVAAVRSAVESVESCARSVLPTLNADLRDGVPRATGPSPAQSAVAARDSGLRAALQADLDSTDPHRRYFAQSVEDALARAAADGRSATLLTYDPDDPPRQGGVAIAIGDLARAASVSVVVPGVMNSPTRIGDSLNLAYRLNNATDKALPRGQSATVLWFDYDIPVSWPDDNAVGFRSGGVSNAVADTFKAVDASDPMAGGVRLAAFVGTLRPLIDGAARLALIGHSDGSVVASAAALNLKRGAGVDDVVLLGSPGAGYAVGSAEDYGAVDPDHVFVLSYPGDPIPHVGQNSLVAGLNPVTGLVRKRVFGVDRGPFGPNPHDPGFGAQVMTTPSNKPTSGPADFGQHSIDNYLSGESLDAVGAVAAGQYTEVPVRDPQR